MVHLQRLIVVALLVARPWPLEFLVFDGKDCARPLLCVKSDQGEYPACETEKCVLDLGHVWDSMTL